MKLLAQADPNQPFPSLLSIPMIMDDDNCCFFYYSCSNGHFKVAVSALLEQLFVPAEAGFV